MRSRGQGGGDLLSYMIFFSYGVLSPDFNECNKKSQFTEGAGLLLRSDIRILVMYPL